MLSFFFHPLSCTIVYGCRINGLGCELYYRCDRELVRIKSVFRLACFNSSKLNLAISRYRDTALHVLKGFLQHPDTDRTCSLCRHSSIVQGVASFLKEKSHQRIVLCLVTTHENILSVNGIQQPKTHQCCLYMLFLYMKVVIYPDNLLLEKPFKPDLLYNTVVHFYIDKKGFSKDKANAIAQAVVKKETERRICKNEMCRHLAHDHIRNAEICLVNDCECTKYVK